MAWLAGYTYRKQIDVQDTNVDGDLTNFQLRVFIDADGDMDVCQADGDDVRFTQSDGSTELKYEMESWSGGGGSAVTANFWVKVPSIAASGGATIYMYYDDDDAVNGEDAANVWDSYVGVWHLQDTAPFDDSTGNGHSGADTATSQVAGIVSDAREWNHADDLITVSDAADLDGMDDLTITAWGYAESDGPNDYAKMIVKGAGNPYDLELPTLGTAGWGCRVNGSLLYESSGGPGTSAWFHGGLVYERDTVGGWKLYINGAWLKTTDAPDAAVNAGANDLIFGNRADAAYAWDGHIDEVRIAATARSINWLKFEYYNIKEADNELTWGNEETEAGGHPAIKRFGGVPFAASLGRGVW